MRIISKFHDFYDSVVASTEYPIWKRNTVEYTLGDIENNKLPLDNQTRDNLVKMLRRAPSSSSYPYMSHYLLGLCGAIHRLFIIRQAEDQYPINSKIAHAYLNIDDAIEKHTQLHKEPTSTYTWTLFRRDFTRTGLDNWLSTYAVSARINSLFELLNTPVFIIHLEHYHKKCKLVKNPDTTAYGLYKIFNPYIMHQDIDIYLGNELATQHDPDTYRDDDLIRDMHGFNKQSFRKEKQ